MITLATICALMAKNDNGDLWLKVLIIILGAFALFMVVDGFIESNRASKRIELVKAIAGAIESNPETAKTVFAVELKKIENTAQYRKDHSLRFWAIFSASVFLIVSALVGVVYGIYSHNAVLTASFFAIIPATIAGDFIGVKAMRNYHPH